MPAIQTQINLLVEKLLTGKLICRQSDRVLAEIKMLTSKLNKLCHTKKHLKKF